MSVREGGRLALREEGPHWVCYWALPNTMEGAIRLGSIAMVFVENPERRQQFIELMQACLGDSLAKAGAPVDHWTEPRKARL